MSDKYLYCDSSFTSKYYEWFCELGYPQLDINKPDCWLGEWAILQMHNAPVMPSRVEFNYVLTGLKYIEPTFSFCKKYVELIDTAKKAFWEREERITEESEKNQELKEKYAEETAEQKLKVIKGNELLMERVAKFGLNQLGLDQILKNLTPYERRRLLK